MSETVAIYNKWLQEWIHLYDGKDTPQVITLEKQMDNVWENMSVAEREECLIYNAKRLEEAAAVFTLACDGVKNHE